MEESKLVKVVEVSEPKEDKNGINYRTIRVATPEKKKVKDSLTGEVSIVQAKAKIGTFNVFEHNYLDLSALATKEKVEIKDLKKKDIESIPADFGYDLRINDKLEGWIVSREVVPYPIYDAEGEERIVNFYTTVVLGDTGDPGFEQAILQTFSRSRDGDGNPIQVVRQNLDMTPIAVTSAEETFATQEQE